MAQVSDPGPSWPSCLSYQVHFPAFLKETSEAVEALNREVAKGRLKSWGVCNFGPKNLKTLLDQKAVPVVNQVNSLGCI